MKDNIPARFPEEPRDKKSDMGGILEAMILFLATTKVILRQHPTFEAIEWVLANRQLEMANRQKELSTTIEYWRFLRTQQPTRLRFFHLDCKRWILNHISLAFLSPFGADSPPG
jgi:hypothetical protein